MENPLIPASLVLIVTNIVFALLSNHWRAEAKHNAQAALDLGMEASRARPEGHAEGWEKGKRHGIGLMYKIACKADHEGRDVIAALFAVVKEQRAEEALIVQVLERA